MGSVSALGMGIIASSLQHVRIVANTSFSLEQNIGIIVASLPALRQLFAFFRDERQTLSLVETSRQLGPKQGTGDRLRSSDKVDEDTIDWPGRLDIQNGGKSPRKMSMTPRMAGSSICLGQKQKLDPDLLHFEDERMSPRETPWATPRVSPIIDSFASRHSSYACTATTGRP